MNNYNEINNDGIRVIIVQLTHTSSIAAFESCDVIRLQCRIKCRETAQFDGPPRDPPIGSVWFPTKTIC